MFTAFMNDASNIMSFYGDVDVKDGIGYSVELWVFKPQATGKQVLLINKQRIISDVFVVVFHGCAEDGWHLLQH